MTKNEKNQNENQELDQTPEDDQANEVETPVNEQANEDPQAPENVRSGVSEADDVEIGFAETDADDESTQQPPEEEVLPLLPLRGTVVLPMTLVPLAAAQERSLRLATERSRWSCRPTPRSRAPGRTTSWRSGRLPRSTR